MSTASSRPVNYELIELLRCAARSSARLLTLSVGLGLCLYALTSTLIIARFIPKCILANHPALIQNCIEAAAAISFLLQLSAHLIKLRSDYLTELSQKARHLCLLSNGLAARGASADS